MQKQDFPAGLSWCVASAESPTRCPQAIPHSLASSLPLNQQRSQLSQMRQLSLLSLLSLLSQMRH